MQLDFSFGPGRLVILSGPSGVGKDTVLLEWQKVNPLIVRVVAATTRAPRSGEVDGVDYHFLAAEEFLSMAAQGGFLEHKQYGSCWYGTPVDQVRSLTSAGKVALLKIEVQGAAEVRLLIPSILSIFLLPPSFEELEARIRRRATETEEQIQKRLARAKQEIEEAPAYTHQVVNGDLKRCVEELEGILNG
jgi:guanylate kinase